MLKLNRKRDFGTQVGSAHRERWMKTSVYLIALQGVEVCINARQSIVEMLRLT